ncbi:MAG: hypothetical protein II850_09895 [Fibrobacter sp.]|nr:hypothetical protein [Fibrobacter sp.]
MAAEKHYFQFFNKLLVLIAVALSFCIVACSGADGKDGIAGADGRDGRDGLAGTNGKDGAPGADGKDAVVNLDSLADAIRKEISGSLWDSVKTAPNIDTVYKNLFDQAFGEAWMDSTRQAIIDSLYAESYMDSVNGDLFGKAFGKEWMDSVRQTLIDSLYAETYVDSVYKSSFDSAFSEAWLDSARQAMIDSLKESDYDSLYNKLYDSVYSDIYRQSVIRTLYAEDAGTDDVYGAFANQYSLMYKDVPVPMEDESTMMLQSPFPIFISDSCDVLSENCNQKKVMVKTWISGYTDTITTTGVVKPRSRLILFPSFKFKDNALSALSAPKQTLRHIEAYALENDHKMLFHSESKPVTIHPMQIFGKNELGLFLNPNVESPQWWYGAWVTPTADSITQIVAEVAKKLPDGEIKVYQSYYPEFSMAINSKMVVENVFEVLQSRNIKYVQNDGGASLGQRVNYPVETLRKKQGICIETATLFASILERLGFRTRLIFIPDHVFVGWMTDREGNVIDLVESTMIGDPNSTFVDANNAGIEEWQEQIDLGNFDTGKATTVRMEDVRQFGIMPNNIP